MSLKLSADKKQIQFALFKVDPYFNLTHPQTVKASRLPAEYVFGVMCKSPEVIGYKSCLIDQGCWAMVSCDYICVAQCFVLLAIKAKLIN